MSFARSAGGALLATGLVATMGLGSYWSAQTLQSTLADEARLALESRALTATVQFDGRDATVWAASPGARDQAVAALLTIPGVRVVVAGDGTPPENASAGSTVTVARSSSPSATPYSSVTATPTVTTTPSASLTPSPSSTPSASASSQTPSPTPTPTPAPTLSIPAWPAIMFLGGTAVLDATDKAQLAQVAQFLVANPTVKVTLTGHTDMGRTESERQALGLARAKAAAAYLVAGGVPATRITTLSRGGSSPVASNTTAAGRAANRRVTIAMTQES